VPGVPYRVWVAHEDPSERERDFADVKRYVVMRLEEHGADTWGENRDADDEPAFESDDPAALVAWFSARMRDGDLLSRAPRANECLSNDEERNADRQRSGRIR
jgi:hypothetical protein